MAIEKRFEAPLQVVHTEQMRERIRAIADREKISQAEVIRDILDAGIGRRERGYTLERLRQDVQQALGAASTCWHGGTAGLVFDSEQASQVADDLLETLGLVRSQE